MESGTEASLPALSGTIEADPKIAEAVDEAATQSLAGVEAPAQLREDQIKNAIAFLNHPKVQGSSEAAKTTFLEKKGLTSEEIKEAFSRAAKTNTGVTSIASTSSPALPSAGLGAPVKPYHGTQATIQALQPRNGLQLQHPQTLKWTQVVLGASVVLAGAYALKQLVAPVASRWYRQFYGIQAPQTASDQQRAQENKTAEIVAAAIESQTKELKSTVDSLKDMLSTLEKDRGKQTPSPNSASGLDVDDLRSELHAFASTLTSALPRQQNDSDLRAEIQQIKQLLSQQAAPVANGTPTPMSEPFTSAQSGLKTSSRVGPPAARAFQAQPSSSRDSPTDNESSQPSYMEVLEMLERGETPPNVRTDINDKPPNPSQPPPNSQVQPKLKPWERNPNSSSATNGDVRPWGTGNPHHTSITELDSDTKSQGRKSSGGAWRPPSIPQASIRHSNPPSKAESETDAASEHSADRANEVEE